MIRRLFTEHPASVGETYGQHLAMASGFSLRMLAGAAVCFVHAVLPFLFVRTGSAIICGLHERMVTHRRRRPAADADAVSPEREGRAPVAAEVAR